MSLEVLDSYIRVVGALVVAISTIISAIHKYHTGESGGFFPGVFAGAMPPWLVFVAKLPYYSSHAPFSDGSDPVSRSVNEALAIGLPSGIILGVLLGVGLGSIRKGAAGGAFGAILALLMLPAVMNVSIR